MRQLPPFPALRAFEAAARLGGFAAASQALHQTPSAISHQVRALEAWFQRPLFVRSVRRVTLTEDGQRLLAELSAAFDQIEDACAALSPRAAHHTLAVHCAPSFASKWLGPRLSRFMRAHPGVNIRLSSGPDPVDLKTQADVDVDISYGPPPAQAGVMVQPLGDEPTLPLASPRLFAGGTPPVRARDVLRHPLIDSRLNPVQWADWCRLNGVKLPAGARPSFDRGSLAVAAAVDGLGIALETPRFPQAELQRGELMALDGAALKRIAGPTHFLRWRKSRQEPQPLAQFRQWLMAELEMAAG